MTSVETLMADWAREAAAVALAHWRGGRDLTFKAGREAVTEADPAIERLLRARIAAAFPGDRIVGEELGGESDDRGRTWHLDPIDGTLNFALGLPGFCISMALVQDGLTTAACIHVPVGGDTFTAVRGGGARLDGRPLAVSTRRRLADAVLSVQFKKDSRFGRDPRLLQSLLLGTLKLRKVGAVALELAWVAAGCYDGLVAEVPAGIQPYDVAAGLLLIEEAGGRVTDASGWPYRPGGPDLVATSGAVHEELCALLGAGG